MGGAGPPGRERLAPPFAAVGWPPVFTPRIQLETPDLG